MTLKQFSHALVCSTCRRLWVRDFQCWLTNRNPDDGIWELVAAVPDKVESAGVTKLEIKGDRMIAHHHPSGKAAGIIGAVVNRFWPWTREDLGSSFPDWLFGYAVGLFVMWILLQ